MFKTPEKLTSVLRRPVTAYARGRQQETQLGVSAGSPVRKIKTVASKKPAQANSLALLVRKNDRIKVSELIEFLQNLLETAKRVPKIHDSVGKISEKILKWKKSFGDLDQ